eukprot:6489045-Pyramimonas_sp.AAC.1
MQHTGITNATNGPLNPLSTSAPLLLRLARRPTFGVLHVRTRLVTFGHIWTRSAAFGTLGRSHRGGATVRRRAHTAGSAGGFEGSAGSSGGAVRPSGTFGHIRARL